MNYIPLQDYCSPGGSNKCKSSENFRSVPCWKRTLTSSSRVASTGMHDNKKTGGRRPKNISYQLTFRLGGCGLVAKRITTGKMIELA